MGLGQSKPESASNGAGDTTFFAAKEPTTVNFSESLLNQLTGTDGAVPVVRQDTLDKHIQERIHNEISRLQKQEAEVREQIAKALEKENLGREAADGGSLHSTRLLNDLSELEKRTLSLKDSLLRNTSAPLWEAVNSKKESLTECLLANKKTPLNCKELVEEFKSSVAGLENSFISSLN